MINQNLFTKHNLSINTIPPISIYDNSDGLNTQVIVKEELIEMDDSAHAKDSEIFCDYLIEHPTPAACTVLATNVSHNQILKKTLNNKSRADSRRKRAERALDVSCVKPKRYQNRVQTEETNESLVSHTSEASQLTINTSSPFITPATGINDKIDVGTLSNDQRKANRKRRNVNTKKDTKNVKDTRPAPATNNKSITIEKEDKVDISILTNKQKKAMICETIHKLTYLIEEYKPSMIANYNLECQRVREEKKMNKDSKKRLPKKRFPWCNRSRLLLDRLIKLAGSEQAGAMILSEKVLPLFPKGFARMPTLLRMAGCKSTIVPEVKRQMFDTVSPILHQAPKILPSQIISVKTPREENVTLSLPFIVNTFSLNADSNQENKGRQNELSSLVPV